MFWALDFNVNPMCSVLGQTIDGLVRILDELILPDSNTLQACEEFLARTEKWYSGSPLSVAIYGDASGEQRHAAASRTDWQLIKNFFSRYPDRYRVTYCVPKVTTGQTIGSTA